MTVDDLLSSISSEELSQWIIFLRIKAIEEKEAAEG